MNAPCMDFLPLSVARTLDELLLAVQSWLLRVAACWPITRLLCMAAPLPSCASREKWAEWKAVLLCYIHPPLSTKFFFCKEVTF